MRIGQFYIEIVTVIATVKLQRDAYVSLNSINYMHVSTYQPCLKSSACPDKSQSTVHRRLYNGSSISVGWFQRVSHLDLERKGGVFRRLTLSHGLEESAYLRSVAKRMILSGSSLTVPAWIMNGLWNTTSPYIEYPS